MLQSRVGQSAGVESSYLMNGRNIEGDPVIKLDRTRDYKVEPKDEVLVQRSSTEGVWTWSPVKSVQDLQQFLSQSSPADRGEQLGLWKDKKRALIFPPDGKIQESEVTPLGQRYAFR